MNKLLRATRSSMGSRMRLMLALGVLLGLGASSALSAAEPVVVKLWNWDVSAKKFQQKMYKLFSERNPDIKIEYNAVSGNSYDQTLKAAIQAKDPPDLFLPFYPSPYVHPATNRLTFQSMVKEGLFKPLNEVAPSEKALKDWMARFPPVLRKFVEGERVFDGKLYTVDPWGPTLWVTVLHYNKALFKSAGVSKAPATYGELRRAAAKITQTGQAKYFGITRGLGTPQTWDWTLFSSLAWAGGAPGGMPSKKDGKFHESGPENVAALSVWIGMRADGSVLPGEETMDNEKAERAFATSQAAMLFGGPWVPKDLKAINPDLELDFDYVLPPTPDDGIRRGFLGAPDTEMGVGYVVSSATKHPDAVWRVIEFICSLEYQQGYVNGGYGVSYLLEANKPENLPNPRMYQFIEWVMDPTLRRILPEYSPQVWRAFDFWEPVVNPSYEEVFDNIYFGRAGLDALKDLDKRLETALDNAIKKAQEAGVKVSRQDFIFPDWDPLKDYQPKKK